MHVAAFRSITQFFEFFLSLEGWEHAELNESQKKMYENGIDYFCWGKKICKHWDIGNFISPWPIGNSESSWKEIKIHQDMYENMTFFPTHFSSIFFPQRIVKHKKQQASAAAEFSFFIMSLKCLWIYSSVIVTRAHAYVMFLLLELKGKR